ncbi:MAG: tetratricopeptide repeat protein [Desulfovibrio sp.]|jgi:Flp pilus assembly protein TadD|nr:tetratricopeptide repeat protein [Desulfovibrio sp.]
MEPSSSAFSRPGASTRALVIFLALSFSAMLLASLSGNFQPARQTPRTEPAASNAAMERDIGLLMQRASREPNNLEVLTELTEALIAARNWDAAETFAKRAVTLDTRDQRPHYLLGVILHNKGQHREAAESMKSALAVRETAPLHYSLGVLYTYFLNEEEHGREHFAAALNLPDADEELKQAIRQELDKRDADKTGKSSPTAPAAVRKTAPPPLSREMAAKLAQLEKAALNNPEDASVWTELGNLHFDTGRTKEAIAAYERSLRLAPDNPDVLTDLGIMYRDAGDFDTAVEKFTQASTLDPKHENALFNLGIVYFHDLKRKGEAKRAWDQLLKINPGARAPDGQPVSELARKLN